MKFCHRAYDHLYVGDQGIVRPCSWVNINLFNLGNLLNQTVEEIWNGEKVQQFRDSILDGSFKYCVRLSCPFLCNDSLPDLTPDEYEQAVARTLKAHPTEINMAYDSICNHACPVCRSDVFVADQEYRINLEKIGSRLLETLNKADLIMANGRGDLFSSPQLLEQLSRVHPINPECQVLFETNGVLLKKNWKKLRQFEKYAIILVITPNSFNRYTYKNLSGNKDTFDSMMESLRYAAYLRQKNRIRELRLTMVVQDRNFREIPSFIDKALHQFRADRVTLRPVLQWFGISKMDYWYKNLMNPLHPYHQEYLDVMSDPICKNPKVYHWHGDLKTRKAVSLQEILQSEMNQKG